MFGRRFFNEEDQTDQAEATLMKPTVAWMSAKFDVLNARFFNGELPKPEMRVEDLGPRTCGNFSFDRHISIDRRSRMPLYAEFTDNGYIRSCDLTQFHPVIKMNSGFSRTEKMLENTLCHEMVHWYVDWRGCMGGWGFPKQGHGTEFRDQAYRINLLSNGEMDIKRLVNFSVERIEKDDRLTTMDERRRLHAKNLLCHVIWIKYKDGINGFLVCYPASTTKILNELRDINRWKHHIESIRYLEDGLVGNRIKNELNLSVSRKYSGYYDFAKFPAALEICKENESRFEDYWTD